MKQCQSKLKRWTLCRWTLGVFVLCCIGCQGINGNATFDSVLGRHSPHHRSIDNVPHLGPYDFVGANAGYCETNWTSLEPVDGWIETIDYGPMSPVPVNTEPQLPEPVNPAPASTEPGTPLPVPPAVDTPEQTTLEQPNDALVHALPADRVGVAYVQSCKGGLTDSNGAYKEVWVAHRHSRYPQHEGGLDVNPEVNKDQTARKQPERWRPRS